jgi:hypothetical protein
MGSRSAEAGGLFGIPPDHAGSRPGHNPALYAARCTPALAGSARGCRGSPVFSGTQDLRSVRVSDPAEIVTGGLPVIFETYGPSCGSVTDLRRARVGSPHTCPPTPLRTVLITLSRVLRRGRCAACAQSAMLMDTRNVRIRKIERTNCSPSLVFVLGYNVSTIVDTNRR